MKVSLKGLPDTLRGGAWPTSACVVRCPVKSGNRRDLHLQLLTDEVALWRDCQRKLEEGVGDVRWYAPNPLGYTRATMAEAMRCNAERQS